jgi:Resolvase, N terminal domain
MKVALYARVSTQRQAQAQTSAQQLERLRAHLQAQGYEPSDEDIFDDEGYSGALLRRPALDRLCDAMQHPKSLRYALDRAHGGHWAPEHPRTRRARLQAGQAQLSRQLERLTEAYLSAVVPLAEYQRRRQDIEQQLQTLRQTERQLEADSRQQSEVASLAKSIEEFAARAAHWNRPALSRSVSWSNC